MKAVLCPVCQGSGEKVRQPFLHAGGTSTLSTMLSCRGCGGKGWVEVHEEIHLQTIPERQMTNYTMAPETQWSWTGTDASQ